MLDWAIYQSINPPLLGYMFTSAHNAILHDTLSCICIVTESCLLRLLTSPVSRFTYLFQSPLLPHPSLHDLSILHPKPMIIHLPNRFQWHVVHLSIAKDDKHPPNKTYASIEPERPGRSYPLHHGEKCRRDNDVTAPAGDGVHHGPQRADLERQEFRSDPGGGCDPCGVEGDVENDCDEEEDAGPVDLSRLDGEVVADGDPTEGDGGDDERYGLYRPVSRDDI